MTKLLDPIVNVLCAFSATIVAAVNPVRLREFKVAVLDQCSDIYFAATSS